ncbi:DUF3786 domain-containing protein [Thermodesulfobacteriota bacterium]
MSMEIDPQFFRELAEKNPEDVCREALCSYDEENCNYSLYIWGDEYQVFPHENKIKRVTDNLPAPGDIFYFFILHYLLHSKESEIKNEWISEKEIPGGDLFFTVSHEIPTSLICERYGNDIDEFKRRCVQLQGTSLELADASYSFNITPRIPVAVLFWAGDEDFPPESKMLFDKSIAGFLAPDIVLAMAYEVCIRIGKG